MQKFLGAITIFILIGLLVAGLWPFDPYPPNEVSWLSHGNGLHLGNHAAIWSASPLQLPGSQGEEFCSFEVWLQPAVEDGTQTLLAFSTPENPLRLELQQYLDSLLILRNRADQPGRSENAEMEIDHVFRREKQVLITITSGPRRTAVYVDGRLVKSSARLGLTKDDLAGQLVFGTSPVGNDSWRGDLLGLALYDRELTETQVAQNYRGWIQSGRPSSLETEGTVALYLFDEHAGSVVHGSARWAPSLSIPEHFKVLRKPVLARPRGKDFVRLNFWEDVFLNVGAFIPLGFIVCAYLSSAQTRRAALAAIIVGAAVGLTIEILQVYLPTRDSDLTDLVTNTSGTIVGVLLYRRAITRAFLASLHRIRHA